MVYNSLFNQPLMNKYIKNYKKEFKLTHSKKESILKWIKKLENNELKDEVANYGLFSRIILEDILGYDYEENVEENVPEEYGSGFSEFAIKKDNEKFMVIELKGQNTNLDKPQNRKNDKRTPIDQAFDYSKNSGEINWIFISNYKEFRLYNWHKKQHQYICFEAEDLRDPEIFKRFMLVFSKFSIENNLIEKLVSKTHFVERELEDEFYKLYNETRLMLITELEHIHPEFTREESVHNAQLILNRYIFICFAEDLGLLPEEISVESIENPIKNNNLGRSEIWHRLNSLFMDVNEGNDYKKIDGYNGGLFSEDLEFLKIRDVVDSHSIFKDAYQKWKFEEYSSIVEAKLSSYGGKINPIYKNLMTISTFNFSSEVDVNILGHIFENSIGDIEELKEDIKGRRKKEGIFYTPEYITDYICRNTIIPYLSISGKANDVNDLIQEYSWGSDIEKLDLKLKNIKIVDPACGSGAFLNKGADVLLDIHKAIYNFKKGFKKSTSMRIGKGKRRRSEYIQHFDLGSVVFDAIEKRREILLNNIYGVDLNKESVEITKLSLFLKVCKKGLKLPNLDNNIKCGNSLIEDSNYAFDEYFNWNKEFKNIFDGDKFDIVIGNPPYVRQQKIKDIKPYLKNHYETYNSYADLYVYFFEKGIKLLKKGGKLGFISSNKFIKASYGKTLRKFILKDLSFLKYNDYTFDDVFKSATAYPSIFILENTLPSKESKVQVNDEFKIDQKILNGEAWNFVNPEILNLKEKIYENGIKIKDIKDIKIKLGILTGYNKAFIIDYETKKLIEKEDFKSNEIIKPLIRGKDLKRNYIEWKGFYIIVSKYNFHNELKNYPAVLKHLQQYEIELKNKSQVKINQHHWLELDNNPRDSYLNGFDNPKLIYPEIAPDLFTIYDENGYYLNNKCFMITSDSLNLNYLGAILSSKVVNFVFKFLGTSLQGNYYNLSKPFIKELPICFGTIEEQEKISGKAERIVKNSKRVMEEIYTFKKWLRNTFNVFKLSKKLDQYYELTFDEFKAEMKKKKVKTEKRDIFTLLDEEFHKSLGIIKPLQQEIEKTDNEIDQMVYELYGLSEDEIKIIKDSIN